DAAAAAAIAAANAASSAPSTGSGDAGGTLVGSNIPFGPAPPDSPLGQDGPTLPDGSYYTGGILPQNWLPLQRPQNWLPRLGTGESGPIYSPPPPPNIYS
ncbi:MAG: hypothetical protein JWM53_3800, partial [bacterium]|nr:hypothetical protein [bacterium]